MYRSEHEMLNYFIIIFLLVVVVVTIVVTIVIPIIAYIIDATGSHMTGGAIPTLSGPVDLLQLPRQLIMDGYRFQDSLYPPDTNLNSQIPAFPQRVGVFKDKAYVIEHYTSPSPGSMLQISARGEQDQYLTGETQPIEDSNSGEGGFGQYIGYAPPERRREINYPNDVFSVGDVINRYHGQITLT